MFKRITVAACALAVAATGAAPASASDSVQTANHKKCGSHYTQKQFHRVARKVFRSYTEVSRHERRTLRRVLHCQEYPRPKSIKKLRGHLRNYKAKHAIRREWHGYKTNQMPWCTWGPESGAHLAPFDPARYTAKNPSSTAAGKFQFLDSTWHYVGGPNYEGSHDAAKAPPLLQERLARVLAREGIAVHWVNC